MNNRPTYFDVCSGIGMGSLAADVAGFDVVGHCEIHPYCQAVLRKHWPEVPIFDDLRQLTAQSLRERGIDRVDLFAGWIPCQPASIAGQRKGASDDRWLWGEFLRLVREIRPLWLLAENPTGALSLEVSGDDGDKQFIDWVCDALEAEGYEVQAYVIGAWSVGSPQRRDRVFIVGTLVNADSGAVHARREPRRTSQANCLADTTHGGLRRGRSPELGRQLTACGEAAGMANATGGQLPIEGWGSETRTGIAAGSATLGNSTSHGIGDADVQTDAGSDCREAWGVSGSSGNRGNGVDLVDANHSGQQEQWLAVTTDARQPKLGSGRQSQPRLGGTASGPTWRLDRPLWPAGRGAEQFGYEPPRLAKGTAYRQERLMALGNMVVPECALPFFEFICNELTNHD